MKFIDQGPNIPEQLLREHSDGRVVFFCGAGVSYPAGLPVFKGLVEEVYNKLGEPFIQPTLKGGLSEAINLVESMLGEAQVTGSSSMEELHNLLSREASNRGEPVPEKPDERAAFTAYKYDQTLNLLEQRIDFPSDSQRPGQSKMRMTLLDILKPKKDRLSVHHALLHLSRHDGKLRLVTTNFDHLFEMAHAGIGPQMSALKHFTAPMLPPAKPTQWDGLVYLHGRLPNKADSTEAKRTELRNLVLTSGDFGRGYLTERWATRFINELFQHYTICFVGYSIEDPVMRYMMDAINADASKGEVVRKPYAFAGFTSESTEQTEASWKAKGVEPILYEVHMQDGEQDHSKLYETLTEWSDKFTGGVSAKVDIIRQYAGLVPTETTKENPFVDQVVWALTDSSGSAATAFAEHKPTPPLEWFDELLKNNMLVEPVPSDRSQQQEPNILRQYVYSDPFTNTIKPSLALALAKWLGEYLLDARLLYKVAKWGYPNPFFLRDMKDHLFKLIKDQKELVDRPIVKLWQLVFAGKLVDHPRRRSAYEVINSIQLFGYQAAQRAELKAHFEPKLRLQKRYLDRASPDSDIRSLFEVTFPTQFASSVPEEIRYEQLDAQELALLTDDAITLVDDAVALWQEVQDNVSHLCIDHMPSIDSSYDSELIDSWTALIRVARDAWSHYNLSDGASAASLPRQWVQSSNPAQVRLALFAASKSTHITSDEFIGWLCDSRGRILRSKTYFRETVRLLDERSGDITDHHAQVLIECLLDDTSLDEVLDKKNIWLIVARLVESGRAVGESALVLYRLGREQNWKSRSEGQWEEFPYKIDPEDESIWGKPKEFQPPPEISEHLPQWIRLGGAGNQYMDHWYDYCENNIPVAVNALATLASEGEIQFHYWLAVLVTGRETFGRGMWNELQGFIQSLPDEPFSKLSSAIAELMREIVMPDDLEDQAFMFVISRLINTQLPEGTSVVHALDFPCTIALSTLIKGWHKQGIEEEQGIPDTIRTVTEETIRQDPLKAIPASARIVLFYKADKQWTRQNLLPLFRHSDSVVRLNAWISYLTQPMYHHGLYKEWIRELASVSKNYEDLGRFGNQYAAFLTDAAVSLEDLAQDERESVRRAFKRLPSSALCQCLVQLQEQYGNAPHEAKTNYWSSVVKPFLQSYWPENTESARSSEVSAKLISLVVTCKDEFEQACDYIEERLHCVKSLNSPLHSLNVDNFDKLYPDRTLNILDRIIGDNIEIWDVVKLADVLRNIINARQDLAREKSYKRIRSYVNDPSLPS